MSVSQAAPSPFAALLRRSKFASYDPYIGQVYTTHGGHAHRGNWGFKRPLPNRRRVGFVTVRTVDSPEQQTEWNSAESSARWIRRWEELGKKLEIAPVARWENKETWSVDSEFDRAGMVGTEPGRERQREQCASDPYNKIPNFDAMSPKQFEKYLERVRALRPEFKKYLEKRWKEQEQKKLKRGQGFSADLHKQLGSEMHVPTLKLNGAGDIDMYASSLGATTVHFDFLADHVAREHQSNKSRNLERAAHKFAGLEYTFMSPLQAQYLHKPAPGRDISQNRAERFNKGLPEKKVDFIGVGGLIGELKEYGSRTIMPTDFGTQESPRRNREQGKGFFRVNKVHIFGAPSVVGRTPQKAQDTQFRQIEFRTTQVAKASISNPHPMGSREYVAWMGNRAAVLVPGNYANIVRKADMYRRQMRSKPPADGAPLVSTLTDMIMQRKD